MKSICVTVGSELSQHVTWLSALHRGATAVQFQNGNSPLPDAHSGRLAHAAGGARQNWANQLGTLNRRYFAAVSG
jgi:hypothetical protein